jgi:hypothetical protein
MSYHQLHGFPAVPASVGGKAIPDFLKFKVLGPVKSHPVPEKFSFSIKDSPLFGNPQGSKFDEGKTWFPIRSVEFGHDQTGLKSFRAKYNGRVTRLRGTLPHDKSVLTLEDKEHITGISGHTVDGGIVDLVVHTCKRQSHILKGAGQGHKFHFTVPEDHQVIAFHGTETGDRITALGVSYQRRLESISDTTAVGDGPAPVLTGFQPTEFLDHDTQASWAKNDMATIEALRLQASNELLPIYANIEQNGNAAWTEVQDPASGQIYYLSWTSNGVIWSYLYGQNPTSVAAAADGPPPTTTSIVTIGSYSKTANFLGISTYNWSNIPTTVVSGIIALGFVYLVRPIIQTGIEMGIALAANLLAEGLAAAGAESAAILVPASVASAGGLVIAGILGIALMVGCIALASVIFRQYFLVVNVYNFDPNNAWATVQHYDDNSVVANGDWKDATIAKFVNANSMIAPPGFNPVKTLNNVVTYLNANFQNNSTFFQGLGEAIVLNRGDNGAALAIKYVVHRLSDNQMAVQGIQGSGSTFDISNFYNNGAWITGKNTSTTTGGLTVNAFTPELSGNKDMTYTFEVNIGLPPTPAK